MKRISKAKRPIVGIDLGTTNSSLAFVKDGTAGIIPLSAGLKLLPSVVHVDREGNVIVGQDAADALVAMPGRTIAAVKRKMGSDEPVTIAGKEMLPEEISALILKELKKYADKFLGVEEIEAIITVPAHFTDAQRKATKRAGELAGFVVERIINEPTAAALAFGLTNLDQDQHILVYDLGGGTFDVSIVEMMGGVMEVKASAGDNQLGGEDFDWKLVELFAQKMYGEFGIDPRGDIRAKALLKAEAEKVKKTLSDQEKCKVELQAVLVKDNKPLSLVMEVTRCEFIGLIEEYLQKTITCLEQVMDDTNLDPEDIDEILLVGGSTRIPRVAELIEGLFDKKPRQDINPDEAVALGAAVQAGLKSGLLAESGFIVTDIAPYSLGVAVLKEFQGIMAVPGGFHAIIPKNTIIPVTRSDIFYTVTDSQTAVEIEVFQGENKWVKDNHRLGEFILSGIPPRRAGQEQVEVTFHYDINGILEVQARCLSTNKAMAVSLKDAIDRQSETAYKDSLARLQEFFDATDDTTEKMIEEFIQDEDHDGRIKGGSLAKLRKEAQLALANGREIMDSLPKLKKGELQELLENLEACLKDHPRHLEGALDRVLDFLIELEMGD